MSISSGEQSYYTSLRDSVRWSVTYVGLPIAGIVLTGFLVGAARTSFHDSTFLDAFKLLLGSVGLSIFLGVLLFLFGWMGRVTVSATGLKAPLFSGIRVFLTWSEIRGAAETSLRGWPCTTIAGGDPPQELYLMVLGGAKLEMIRRIADLAGPDNALVKYLNDPGT